MTHTGFAPVAAKRHPFYRWFQLCLMMLIMMAISTPQYVWALFVKPLQGALDASLSAVQVTFAIFIFMQAGMGPFIGYVVERVPIRTLMAAAGILMALAWVGAAYATSLPALYLTYGVCGGLSTGLISISSIGFATQWFPDKRGLAIGLSSGAYGLGALITTIPISVTMKAYGYMQSLVIFGLGIGLLCLLLGVLLRRADNYAVSIQTSVQDSAIRQFRPAEMVRTSVFWILFVMMVLIGTSGLMIVSQLGAMASDFGITNLTVYGMAALPLALTFDRIMNGLTRPFFGWVSDRIGRPNTMALAFSLEAASIFCLFQFAHDPLLFILLSGVVMFGWGEVYSLFPTAISDYFGTKHASANWGILAVAMAISGILGAPVAALMREYFQSWGPIFYTVVGLDLLTAALAYFLLKPLHFRWSTSHGELKLKST